MQKDFPKVKPHIAIYKELPGNCDQYTCSCGNWKSRKYHDNEEAAYNEWLAHVAEAVKNSAQKS